MSNNVSNDYFTQKKALLKECVSLSEELLSNLDNINMINEILSKRSDKIVQLQKLDDAYGPQTLTDLQKSQINQIVSLLLGLDRDVMREIKVEQADVKNEMKVNTQNHKMVGYKGNQSQPRGRVLDIKK